MKPHPDPRTTARMEAARRWFREHHAQVEPDAHFATRVSARLHRDAAEDLGRAAIRLLPASIAVALVLVWAVTRVAPSRQQVASTTADTDVLTWVLDTTESTR